MSRPDYEMGKVTVQQLTQIPSEQYPPCGITVANYATDPDPETNDPGSIIFNTTSNTLSVARNDGVYAHVAFDGDAPSGNITLTAYGTDAGAPSVNGSIYLNTGDHAGDVRVYYSGSFSSLASTATTLNSFAVPTGDINMSGYAILNAQDPDPTRLTQVVNVGYVLDSTLPSTTTLNSISALNVTTDNINMNTHKITGLSDGVDNLDAVNMQQLAAVASSSYGGVFLSSGTATGQIMAIATRALMSDGTYASTAINGGIAVTGNRLTNNTGAKVTMRVSLQVSVASTAGGSVCTVYIAKNGVTGDAGDTTLLPTADDNYSLGYSTIIALNNGEYVEPFMESSASDTFTVASCYFNITRA